MLIDPFHAPARLAMFESFLS